MGQFRRILGIIFFTILITVVVVDFQMLVDIFDGITTGITFVLDPLKALFK